MLSNNNNFFSSCFLFSILVLFIFCIYNPSPVSGTHFAFGTISWTKQERRPGDTGVYVKFRFQSGWRTTFDWSNRVQSFDPVSGTYSSINTNTPNVGDYVAFPYYHIFAYVTTSTTGNGQVVPSGSGLTKDTGYDYGTVGVDPKNYDPLIWRIKLKVKNLYKRGYFVGEDTQTIFLPDNHAAQGGGFVQKWVVYYEECCRVKFLEDGNAENSDRTFVTVPHRPFDGSGFANYLGSSFNTTSPPRQIFSWKQPIQFKLAYTYNREFDNPSTRTVTFSASGSPSTPPDNWSSLKTAFPSQDPPFTLTSTGANQGTVTWTPTSTGANVASLPSPSKGIYAVSFTIGDTFTNTASPSTYIGHIICLDTIFEIVDAPAATITPIPDPLNMYVGTDNYFQVTGHHNFADQSIATTLYSTVLPDGAVFNPDIVGYNAVYTFRWKPDEFSVPSTICFWAVDEPESGADSPRTCARIVLLTNDNLPITGYILDYKKGTLDFGITHSTDVDTKPLYIDTVLDSTTGLPRYLPGASTTTTNAANFAKWFVQDTTGTLNLKTQKTIYLYNKLPLVNPPDDRIYSTSAVFYPIDGIYRNTFPIDSEPALDTLGNPNQMLGHNNYFTFVSSTGSNRFTYRGGEILKFACYDELFVFFNGKLPYGWNLTGLANVAPNTIHPLPSRVFTLYTDAQAAYLGLQINQTVSLDIFYAHRSSSHVPYLEMMFTKPAICDATTKGDLASRWGDYTGINVPAQTAPFVANTFLLGNAARIQTLANGQQNLIIVPNNGAIKAVSSAWLGAVDPSTGAIVAKKLKIQQGFTAFFDFKFEATGTGRVAGRSAEGFAICFQAYTTDPTIAIVGGVGPDLGYGGSTAGFNNSICVEIDAISSAGYDDVSTAHVSIHTELTLRNDAHENAYPTSKMDLTRYPNLEFNPSNGTVHSVKIQYTAPYKGQGRGVLDVFVYVPNYRLPVPVASLSIDHTSLAQMWQGQAFVGFTGSNTNVNYGEIRILNFNISSLPVSPDLSYAVSYPSPSVLVAGATGTMKIQLVDRCGNPFILGGEASGISASLYWYGQYAGARTAAGVDTTVQPIPAIIDNKDGTYTISYTTTIVGLYEVIVKYGGLEIGGSGTFKFSVKAAAPYAPKCLYTISLNPVRAGTPNQVTVATIDQYGNQDLNPPASYQISFTPHTGGNSLTPPLNPLKQDMVQATENHYFQFYSTKAEVVSMTIQMLKTGNVLENIGTATANPTPADITFFAGAAFANTSTATVGSGLVYAQAGIQASFQLDLADVYNNVLIAQNLADSSCLAGQTPTCYINYLDAALAPVPLVCSWSGSLLTCRYTTTTSGNYNFYLYVNGFLVPSLLNQRLFVAPGPVYPPACTVVPSGSLNVIASFNPTSFILQQRDQYLNVIQIQVPGGANFVVSVASGGVRLPSLPPPYLDAGAYRLDVQATQAGNFQLTITLQGTAINSGNPITGQVVPGPAYKNSTHTFSSATITAGTTTPFSIFSVDQFANPRVTGGTITDYTIFLLSVTTSTLAAGAITSIPNNNANFPAQIGTTIADNYNLLIQVTTNGDNIKGIPFAVKVNPAATSASHCIVSGDGFAFVAYSSPGLVYVQARDQYDNIQTVVNNDQFRLVVSNPVGGSYTTSNACPSGCLTGTASPANSGSYSLSYSAPSSGSGVSQFTLTVQFNSAGTWTDVDSAVVYAALNPSSLQVRPTFNSSHPDFPQGTITVGNSFIINDELNSGNTYGTTLNCLVWSPSDKNFLQSFSASSLNTGLASKSIYFASWTPNFKIMGGTQDYKLNITRGAIPNLLAPFSMTFVAGAVSAALSVVTPGSQVARPADSTSFYTATIQLQDAAQNVLLTRQTISVVIDSALNTIPTSAIGARKVNITLTSSNVCTVCSSVGTLLSTTCVPCDSMNSISFAAGTYTLTWFSRLANDFTLGAYYRSQLISGHFYYYTINPAAPSYQLSTVKSVGSPPNSQTNPGEAGQWAQFYLVIADAYGNMVTTPPASLGVTLSLQDSAGAAIPASQGFFTSITSTSTDGTYLTAINSTVAGITAPIRLVMTVGGNTVQFGAANYFGIYIRPSTLSPSRSSVSAPGSVPAGSNVAFTVAPKDIYGNVWGQDQTQQIFASITVPGQTTQVIKQLARIGTTANFQAIYNLATVAGVYTFDIQGVSAGSTIPLARVTATVVPGPYSLDNTLVPQLYPITAGVNQTIYITLSDSFGNAITNLGSFPVMTVTWYNLNGQVLRCIIGTTNDDSNPPAVTPGSHNVYSVRVVSSGANTGSYRIDYSGVKTGLYFLNVTIAGAPLSCSLGQKLSQTVTAGAVSLARSYVDNVPVQLVAGRTQQAVIHLLDQFDNPTDLANVNNLQFGAAPTFGGFLPTTNQNNLFWFSGPVIQFSVGVYYITLSATRSDPSNPFAVIVTCNGYQVQVTNGSPSTPRTPNVQIVADVPTTVSVNIPTTGIIAGRPFSTLFNVVDRFNNPIHDNNALSNFSLIVSARTFNPAVLFTSLADPQFQPSVSAFAWISQADWAGLSTMETRFIDCRLTTNPLAGCTDSTPGAVLVDAKLTSITVLASTCAAQDPANPYRCPNTLECVSDYTLCNLPASNAICTDPAKPIRCATDPTKCVSDGAFCPCPTGFTRCTSTGTCEANAANCFAPISCPAGTVSCTITDGTTTISTGQCRASSADCPTSAVCSPGFLLCPDRLTCALSLNACYDYASIASTQTISQPSSASISLSSPVVGNITYPPSNLAPTACPLGQSRCANGICTTRLEDCTTPKTCAPGEVLCASDQSCQKSVLQCPEPTQCYSASAPWRCADGSCANSPQSCPVQSTCPIGFVQCDNNQCAQTQAQCLPEFSCPATTVRCADGSCRASPSLCPTKPSCPLDRPVRCSDGACQPAVAYCTPPSTCPRGADNTGRMCPDGSCIVGSSAVCASTPTCPSLYPVLCPDQVCVQNITQCAAGPQCTVLSGNPVRCPDGSCRRNLNDCPTRLQCPVNTPIQCPDGSCQYSLAACSIPDLNPANTLQPVTASSGGATPTNPASPFACTVGSVKCPGLECVANYDLCPTHVTCPQGSNRCADGSCRLQCPTYADSLCTAQNLLTCPQVNMGFICVADLELCPSAPICPANSPVRCTDATCAPSSSNCPALSSVFTDPNNPVTQVPCPDGSWVHPSAQAKCPTLTSCPSNFPYKCFDESCRASPADCPQFGACTDPLNPYRCSNGACAPTPTNTICIAFPPPPTCPADQIRCPYNPAAAQQCQPSIQSCLLPPFYSNQTATSYTPTANSPITSNCPSQYVTCRDGSCAQKATDCPPVTCPAFLPYACDNGICAVDQKSCPNDKTGCYPTSPSGFYKYDCWNGNCYTHPHLCPNGGSAPSGKYICHDYSMVNSAGECYLGDINNCAVRCIDGSCSVSVLPGLNQCNIPGAIDPIKTPLRNVCPPNQPYRCEDGLCVKSNLDCVKVPQFTGVCPVDLPYQCANGLCVKAGIQCPIVRACYGNEDRCGDGSCRLKGQCPQALPGDDNTCPFLASSQFPADPDHPPARRYRCSTGICSTTADASGCVDITTGCPTAYPQRCPNNGACIAAGASCSGVNNKLPTVNNGCPLASPYKCPNGECVTSSNICAQPNGCPPSAPYRCLATDHSCQPTTAACTGRPVVTPATCSGPLCSDGTCPTSGLGQYDISLCKALNGCPILTPWRCDSGECKKWPATATSQVANLTEVCPIAITCPDNLVACASGGCAATAKLCPPTPVQCSTGEQLCPDLTCVAVGSTCQPYVGPNARLSCPATAPIQCAGGSCKASTAECPQYTSPGTGNGGGSTTILAAGSGDGAIQSTVDPSAYNIHSINIGTATPTISTSRCLSLAQVECFDGSCRASYLECQAFSLLASGLNSTAVLNAGVSYGLCPTGQVFCPNGFCAPATCRLGDPRCIELGCGVISRCPLVSPVRCPDGSCRTGNCPSMPDCPSLTISGYHTVAQTRCEDGSCRINCLPYDGCPLTRPYHCANRECAVSGDQCAAAAIGHDFVYIGLANQLTPTSRRRALLDSMSANNGIPAFTTDRMSFPNPAPYTASTADSNSPIRNCYANCQSQVKAVSLTYNVPISTQNTLPITSDPLSGEMVVPAFAFVSASNLSLPAAIGITLKPVSESSMIDSEARVPVSRTGDYGSQYLTYAQTVLSSPFEVAVDSSVVQIPFQLPIQVKQALDMNNNPPASDICFAMLNRAYVNLGFSNWICVSKSIKVQSDIGSNSQLTILSSVRDAAVVGSTSSNFGFGTVVEPGTYAFISSPAPPPKSDPLADLIKQYWIYIVAGIIGAVVFLGFTVYIGGRFLRYRKKYHEERKQVEIQREEVETMEQFGGQAGTKDDEIVMMSNPLVVQMRELQERLDVNAQQRRQEEQKTKEEANTERQKHIDALEADKHALERELEFLKQQVMRRQSEVNNVAAPSAVDVELAPMNMSYGNSIGPSALLNNSAANYSRISTASGPTHDTATGNPEGQQLTNSNITSPKLKKQEFGTVAPRKKRNDSDADDALI